MKHREESNLFYWKKKGVFLAIIFFIFSSQTFAGQWVEKEVVPAEYQKMEYIVQGEIFWLYKPKEKNPTEYFHIEEGLNSLPEGLRKGKDDGVVVANYAYDGYSNNSTFVLIQASRGPAQGLFDLKGNEVLPVDNYSDFKVYSDGFIQTSKGLYKNGKQVNKQTFSSRSRNLPDAWIVGGKEISVVNHEGEAIAKLPFLSELSLFGPDIIIGKSNGKDKKAKNYRVWNFQLEDITPQTEGFLDLVILRKTVADEELWRQELEGFLGRTKEGWALYPYLGDASFGSAIPIESKVKEFYFAEEVEPGYYRLGRPPGDGDFLLDIKNRVVRKDANGVVLSNNKVYYTQEKWTSGRFYMPIAFGWGNFCYGGTYYSIGTVQSDGSHLVRLRDENGEEITTLWESVYLGKHYAVNRYNGETKVLDYNGNVAKRYSSAKEGFIPLVGKKEIPEQEEGKPQQFGTTEWIDWPGGGQYQPYCENGNWGVLDIDTAYEHVSPDSRFGRIIKVSNDGQHFWSYFEKGKLKGIKQFDWVE